MKRLIDILASFIGLLISSPILMPVMFLVWKQDKHSPFYIAPRVSKGEGTFKMIKLRSMVANADKSGVDSTSENDMRITPVGHFIRKCKLDELTQLWNVLKGDMSLVGPRPNVQREADLYTSEEKKLLTVRPGITDIASIVFADEGDILADKNDPDIAYNQLIRPWKSRLGILYIENQSFSLDMKLILLTLLTIVSRDSSLRKVSELVEKLGGDQELVAIAARKSELVPTNPPGAREIVTTRDFV